jgi:hypothetical protein
MYAEQLDGFIDQLKVIAAIPKASRNDGIPDADITKTLNEIAAVRDLVVAGKLEECVHVMSAVGARAKQWPDSSLSRALGEYAKSGESTETWPAYVRYLLFVLVGVCVMYSLVVFMRDGSVNGTGTRIAVAVTVAGLLAIVVQMLGAQRRAKRSQVQK